MNNKNNRFKVMLLTVAIILLVPLIAMQFTTKVNWTSSDFIAAGVLLLGTGFLYELALRKITNTRHRIIVCIIIMLLLLLIWAELAVGIFGTPFTGS